MSSVSAPSDLTASQGSSSSTCSTPSAARNAIFFPSSLPAMFSSFRRIPFPVRYRARSCLNDQWSYSSDSSPVWRSGSSPAPPGVFSASSRLEPPASSGTCSGGASSGRWSDSSRRSFCVMAREVLPVQSSRHALRGLALEVGDLCGLVVGAFVGAGQILLGLALALLLAALALQRAVIRNVTGGLLGLAGHLVD